MARLTVALAPIPGPLFALDSPARTLASAAELGFDAVDVAVGRPELAREAGLADLAAEHGLRVASLLTGPARTEDGLSLSDPATVVEGRRRIAALAELAAELEAGLVVGWMVGVLPEDERRASFEHTLRESLATLVAATGELGVPVLLEPINRYESNVAPTLEAAVALIDSAGGGIELIQDCFHANIEESDPLASAREHAGRTGLVQLSDSNRRMPGDGHFPIAEWVAAIRAGGYRGDFALEAVYGPDQVADAGRALAFMRELGL